MTEEEWKETCDKITGAMLEFARPFACPLSHGTDKAVRLVGTGNLVEVDSRPTIITCDHVAVEAPLNYRFMHSQDVFAYRESWLSEKEPTDVAWTSAQIAPISNKHKPISSKCISLKHSAEFRGELMFFFGFSGENSSFAFDHHVTNGIGFLTQQAEPVRSDIEDIELIWPSGRQEWSTSTTEAAKKAVRFNDPRGLSGSFVWNTRFIESGATLDSWNPLESRVTGMLKRFDDKRSLLLATPIQKIRQCVSFT